MIVAIRHNITDSKKWEEAVGKIGPMIQSGNLPKGVKAVCFLPSTEGHRADCVWEANSLEDLKRFLEPLTSSGAKNEYFQVNTEQAMGLPVAEHTATN